jgi:Carboxypeptidase regulatory-like domain/TonB dependent receptor
MKPFSGRWLLLILIAGVLALGTPANAQSPYAKVGGQITDPQGNVVPDVVIVLTNVNTGVSYTAQTNGSGIYSAPNLPPGLYRANLSKDGFKSIVKGDFELHVQDEASINFQLQVGSVSETVTVEEGGLVIDTTDAAVGTVVDRNFVENLPMSGRTFQTLVYLTPGVAQNMGSGSASNHATGQFSVNGQRATSNYWTVDGVSANIGITPWLTPGNGTAGGLGAFNVVGGTNSLVSVDALQEFRIQTSTYSPEFGRTTGGQISIVTRSGTNLFHGSLFNYFRNTVLDATDWFANANNLSKAAEQQNDFGGVLGGPLVKDKTFFLFSYEGLRLRQPQTILTGVPDLAARNSAIPAIQPFIDAFPVPNAGAADIGPGIAPFNASYSNPASVNAYSVRIDHVLTRNLKIFGRYNYSPSNLIQRGGAGTSANTVFTVESTTQTATLGATWAKSSQSVNEIHFNYSISGGQTAGHMDSFGGGTVAPGASLFPSSFTFKDAVFDLSIDGIREYYQGANAHNQQHQYNIVDTLSMQKGAHTLKFGVDYRRLSPLHSQVQYGLLPNFHTVADLEAGISTETDVLAAVSATLLFRNLGLFAQDTWRVNPRLTVTYGLRWDVDFTPTSENGPSIPAVTGFSRTDLSNLALAALGASIYDTRYGAFAPRVGLAYQVSQNVNWGSVLRTGFGVFYDLASTEVGNHTIDNYPFQGFVSNFGVPFPTPSSIAAPIPIIPPDASQGELVGFDPHLNVPYSLQWSAAFEQALGKAQSLTVSYLGSSGRRLLSTESVNSPNANYLTAVLVANAGYSNYNALQTQFQRRLSNHLQALVSHTWSHSIDTGSYGEYVNGSFTDQKTNRGDSDFDIRNTFSAALTYEVPGLGKDAFTRSLTDGWSVDNILQVHSAPPVDVLDGKFTSLLRQPNSIQVRPDVVAGQPLYLHGPQYPGGKALNHDAFTDPPVDAVTGNPIRQGNLGRNSLRGFGLTEWEFAVHRDFSIRESIKLQFRAEMFNILNHPNFAPYNNKFNGGDPFFGQSTQLLGQSLAGSSGAIGNGGLNSLYQLGGPRSIQLALKLIF